MAQWDVVAPDGTTVTVEAADENEAWEVAQEEIKRKTLEEYENLPWGQKAITALTDEARIFNDALTLGMWDRASSAIQGTPLEVERAKTTAAQNRADPYGSILGADLPAELAGYAVGGRVLPSGVRAAQKAVGGPAAVRQAVGATTAAAETAGLGAIEGGTRNEDPEQFWRDVLEGGQQGAIFGPLGHLAGEGVKLGARGVSAVKDWMAGPKTTGTEIARRKRPTKKSEARDESVTAVQDAMDRANLQAKGATSAGLDKALSTEIEGILSNKKVLASLHPDEQEALRRVVTGDPAMRIGRKLGKIPGYAAVAGGLGGAGVANLFDPVVGTALMTIPAFSVAGKATANKGAKNLANEAMNTIRKTPVRDPSLKPGTQDDIYKVMRMLGL